jgi:hypothetical protein
MLAAFFLGLWMYERNQRDRMHLMLGDTRKRLQEHAQRADTLREHLHKAVEDLIATRAQLNQHEAQVFRASLRSRREGDGTEDQWPTSRPMPLVQIPELDDDAGTHVGVVG